MSEREQALAFREKNCKIPCSTCSDRDGCGIRKTILSGYKATDRCPLITVDGEVFCIDPICHYRELGAVCPPYMDSEEAKRKSDLFIDPKDAFLIKLSHQGEVC